MIAPWPYTLPLAFVLTNRKSTELCITRVRGGAPPALRCAPRWGPLESCLCIVNSLLGNRKYRCAAHAIRATPTRLVFLAADTDLPPGHLLPSSLRHPNGAFGRRGTPRCR